MQSKFIIYLLSLIVATNSSESLNSNKEVINQSEDYGIIFVGDSRTKGLEKAVNSYTKNESIYFISKVGSGYDWLVSDAEDAVNSVISSNNTIKDWSIIANFGVNDIDNYDKYIKEYDRIVNSEWKSTAHKKINLYIESVNPVNEELCTTVTNESIKEFNKNVNKHFSNSNVKFISTYDFVNNIMVTKDGLHYSSNTYKSIYIKVLSYILYESRSVAYHKCDRLGAELLCTSKSLEDNFELIY